MYPYSSTISYSIILISYPSYYCCVPNLVLDLVFLSFSYQSQILLSITFNLMLVSMYPYSSTISYAVILMLFYHIILSVVFLIFALSVLDLEFLSFLQILLSPSYAAVMLLYFYVVASYCLCLPLIFTLV